MRLLKPSDAASLSSDPFDEVHGGAIRAALEAIVTVDEQQRIVMINPAAQRMFGCTAAEALGSQLSRFIPQRHRQAHARHVREFETLRHVERSVHMRGPIVGLRANGEEFPAEASICRVDVSTESGMRHYCTALLRDLSTEQGLKSEVDALRQRIRAIFELAPIAIWVAEGERIVFVNRACVTLFGAENGAALLGRSMYSMLDASSHDSVRKQVQQALAGNAGAACANERIDRLDGGRRDVDIALAALPDHGHNTVQMVIADVTERARMHRELEHSRRELRQLAASQVDAREEERRRIARELHDELGQRLTALKMELSSLVRPSQGAAPSARIEAMLDMVDETVASVRRIATDLRPAMLDDLGLNAAIEWLARETGRRIGVNMALHLENDDPPLTETAAIAVYRMVQEALTNIARHAHASAVRIEMHSQARELVLVVQDNGVGFSGPQVYREGSHGLMGIRERAWMLGGHIEVGNAPEGGGRITVHLPLRSTDEQKRDARKRPDTNPARWTLP